MAEKVTFSGETKEIWINTGVTNIDVQINMYSEWKNWVIDNPQWLAAFRTFGGDETTEGQFAPRYFFLINFWRVIAKNVTTTLQTNLYSDDYDSPFIIENAAVTNRTSDVPIVKTDIDQRLDYGNRIYYDQTSPYTGTEYPVGTIAQPVNNFPDVQGLRDLYNISDIYCLSDVTAKGTGTTISNYTFIADRQNLVVSSTGNTYFNTDWHGFIIKADFGGGDANLLNNCIIDEALNISGKMTNCQIGSDEFRGTVNIKDTLVMSSCYSGIAGYNTPLYDMNNSEEVKLSIRSHSGGLEIINSNTSGDTATVELIAGQIILNSSCTNGYLDLRGVGYITRNEGTGCTVNTLGFVDSFETYIEETKEIDQRLAYQNKIFVNQSSGFTGSTYPIGTQPTPVNNLQDLFQLSDNLNIKNINVQTDFILTNLQNDVESFNTFSDTPHIPLYLDSISGNKIYNSGLYGFDIIKADFAGNDNYFENCILWEITNLAGTLVECDLDAGTNIDDPFYTTFGSSGTSIEIFGNTSFISCRPHYAGDPPQILLVNPSGTTCAFRSWNGDLILDYMTHIKDRVIVEMDAGALTIGSGCTNGIIEVRGVGEVMDYSGDNCIIKRDGQLQASPGEYNGEIVIDTINGNDGILYPIGTNSYPSNNITDTMTLLNTYKLDNIHVEGSLDVDGEDLSYITFSADRSTGNLLSITNSITDHTYIQDLTVLNLVQSGTCRYTTSVLVNVENFDGGAKNCLLISDLNLVGDGLNYLTNCDTYTTDTNNKVEISINDKKLNIIRARGFYNLTNKTGTDTTTIDMVSGIIEVSPSCISGTIYIGGICEVIDNSSSGCTVIYESISRQSVEDSVWDAQISVHLQSGSTGEALNTNSISNSGLTPDDVTKAVWDVPMANHLLTGTTGEAQNKNSLSGLTIENITQGVWNAQISDYLLSGSTGEALYGSYSGSSPEVVSSAVWDAQISDHLQTGSTGDALYNVSAGATPEVIAEAVWNQSLTGFTSSSDKAGYYLSYLFEAFNGNGSSTGLTETIEEMSFDIKRVLGLTQENILIKDHIYDANDLLESANIKIFGSAADCDSDTSPIGQYSMTALYDSIGRLTNYKVTRTDV